MFCSCTVITGVDVGGNIFLISHEDDVRLSGCDDVSVRPGTVCVLFAVWGRGGLDELKPI